jgi:hypothetical protein
MVSEVAKKYNLPSKPPVITTADLDEITANVIEKCRAELEAADAAECASLAHASEIWTC